MLRHVDAINWLVDRLQDLYSASTELRRGLQPSATPHTNLKVVTGLAAKDKMQVTTAGVEPAIS